ncbi:MAG: proteasome assembly chaperone family protein [Halolamina sp.]
MAQLSVVAEEVELSDPMLVEGFPGVGLVGKLAADHLVEALDLVHYANVHCETLPKVAVYQPDTAEVASPVRLYASESGDLVVLQSDVPVEPDAAEAFADCFTPWLEANATPVFVAGEPTQERDLPPAVSGVAAGDAESLLSEVGLSTPSERGAMSGPTGALLAHAVERDLPAVGLIVESDPQFPDPTAARALLSEAILPLTGYEVPLESLVEQAEEIQEAKQGLAQQMGDAGDQSSKATPFRMYQ